MNRTELRYKKRRDALNNLRPQYRSVTTMAEALGQGFSPSFLSQLLNGHRGIGDEVATKIEHSLGLPRGYLDEAEPDTPPEIGIYGKVPLISWAQIDNWPNMAGNLSLTDAQEWLSCPIKHSLKTYVLRVHGESMHNPHVRPSFQEGELIFIDPDRPAEHGSFVIVKTHENSEAVLRKLVAEGGRKYLRVMNPTWQEPMMEINGHIAMYGTVIFKGEAL